MAAAFEVEGFTLSADGAIGAKVLGALKSAEMTAALKAKEGTLHGRPAPTSLSAQEAKASIEVVGTVSAYMLPILDKR